MGLGELARIAKLSALFGDPSLAGRGVVRGIGDDAAVLEPPPGKRLAWTVDEQVEGSHFRRDLLTWEDVGYRSFMAAASDLAAMGSAPWCALASLVLADDVDDAAFEAIARGQRDASVEVGAPIVGGNLARGPVVSITTTLLGAAERPIERGGAQAGDGLWMLGEVGFAAAGLLALQRGLDDPGFAPCIRAWRRPVARVREGVGLGGIAHAAVDVSDGLAQDVGHLAQASGLLAVLDANALSPEPGGPLDTAATRLGVEPLSLVLSGGEDYALVVASDRPLAGFVRIGELRGGAGVVLRRDGHEEPLAARGFDHFRGD